MDWAIDAVRSIGWPSSLHYEYFGANALKNEADE